MENNSVDQVAISAFGRKVVQERKDRGWTKQELSTRSKIDYARVSQIENDPTRIITIEEVIKLANAFEVSLIYLVDG